MSCGTKRAYDTDTKSALGLIRQEPAAKKISNENSTNMSTTSTSTNNKNDASLMKIKLFSKGKFQPNHNSYSSTINKQLSNFHKLLTFQSHE